MDDKKGTLIRFTQLDTLMKLVKVKERLEGFSEGIRHSGIDEKEGIAKFIKDAITELEAAYQPLSESVNSDIELHTNK